MSTQCHCAGHQDPALTPEVMAKVDAIIAKYQDQPGNLMPVLQEVQEAVGYLPLEVQQRLACKLNIPGSDIFGVMSFYSMYTWWPKGKYVIRFCESPPCHILDSENLLEFTLAELGVPLESHHQGRSLHPGENRLPGGVRGGPGHAD